jgi:hypothetical protein
MLDQAFRKVEKASLVIDRDNCCFLTGRHFAMRLSSGGIESVGREEYVAATYAYNRSNYQDAL